MSRDAQCCTTNLTSGSRCTASCPAEGAAWESNPVRASAPVNIVGIEPTAPTFPEETVHGIPNLAVRRLHEGRMAWLTMIMRLVIRCLAQLHCAVTPT